MMATPADQPSLTVLSGSMAGTVFVVDDSVDNVLIGSDASCRFALTGTGVDPIHARLWIDIEGITVYDTDSPRGVFINDDRVEGQARLRNGDILWLGAPGEDASVMLQCRIPAGADAAADPSLETVAMPPIPVVAATPVNAEPEPQLEVEPTIAMMASDLPLEPTIAIPPVSAAVDDEPEPTHAIDIDDTPPPPPRTLLADDAIQPEPTVMLAADDAFVEPEPTVSMLPDDDELAPITLDPEPDATIAQGAPVKAPAAGGWDPLAGGITAAADAPWLAGAPADAFDSMATIASAPPPPPPVPVAPAVVAAAVAPRAAAAPGPSASPRPPTPTAPRAPQRPPAPEPPAKPRRDPPAAVAAPARRAAPPRPPTQAEEDSFVPPRKGAPMGLLIGGALAAAVLVGAGAWWMLRGTSTPEPGTAPPPTVAQARPVPAPVVPGETRPVEPAPPADVPVEEEVTIVPRAQPSASPAATPSRAPSAAPSAQQVARATPPPPTAAAAPAPAVVAAGLVGRAETARKAGELDAAAELFDQALHADPQNAAANAGKSAVAMARAAARKAFMPGRTVVQTQSAKADLSGFDTADVSVKKAPDFSGRIEFAVNPPRVKPGDSYSVQVFLVNEGKKSIKVSSASAITNVNGSKSPRALAPRVKEVAPAQRALLDEMPGVWGEDVNWWSAEVTVAANKGDSLKNTLNWK